MEEPIHKTTDIDLAQCYVLAKHLFDNRHRVEQQTTKHKFKEVQDVFGTDYTNITSGMWFTMSIYLCWLFDTNFWMDESQSNYTVKKISTPTDRFIPIKYLNKRYKLNILNNVLKITFDNTLEHAILQNIKMVDLSTIDLPKIPIDFSRLFKLVCLEFKSLPVSEQTKLPIASKWLSMIYGIMRGYNINTDLAVVTENLLRVNETLRSKFDNNNEMGVGMIMWVINDIWFTNNAPRKLIEEILKSMGSDLPKYIISLIPYLIVCDDGVYTEADQIKSFSGFKCSWNRDL